MLCGVSWNATAQLLVQSKRLEIPLRSEEQPFDLIASGDFGIFLHRRLATFVAEDRMELVKLDTGLNINWHGFLPIDKKTSTVSSRTAFGRLYILMKYEGVARKDFQLFAVEQANGNFIRYNIRNFIAFQPIDFQITEQAAIIGGYFNQVPVVIYYHFATQRSKILPGLLNESGELTQIKPYDDGSFDVLISARNLQGQQTIWIKNYDQEGSIARNLALVPEGNKHLIFARSLKTNNDMQLVAGVYGNRNSEYSKGLFIASIDPSGLQTLKYFGYGDLENFFKYMKARREQRVKERIERRRVKGKKTRFNYRFLVHEIVPYQGQYVLLGEAFYPRYVTVDRSSYGGFFNPYSFRNNYTMVRDGRVFDGYRYTHAVVMGFDPDGRLLWDNSFEINDVRTFTLEQFVRLDTVDDKLMLVYLFDNKLRTKVIKGSQVLEGKTSEVLKTQVEGEEPRTDRNGVNKLNYWYNDYFIAHGVQEVLNPALGVRRVFFINRISHDR